MKRRRIKQVRKLVWWSRKRPGYLFRKRAAEMIRRGMEAGLDPQFWKYTFAERTGLV